MRQGGGRRQRRRETDQRRERGRGAAGTSGDGDGQTISGDGGADGLGLEGVTSGRDEEGDALLLSRRGSAGSVSSGDDVVFHDAREDWDGSNVDVEDANEEEIEDEDEDEDEAYGVADGGGHGAAEHAATLLKHSVHLCIALAILAYAAIGICGYGLFGENTADDILLNIQMPALDAVMTLYQCVCFSPTFHSLRYTVDALADGVNARRPSYATHVSRVSALLVGSMAVATLVPDSEMLFALTGAVGVCAVCYVLPVAMHLSLQTRSGGGAGGDSLRGPEGSRVSDGVGITTLRWAVPLAALFGGISLSAMGLYATLRDV